MFAVERLGSYITRGVNTVSGPFHPFGGAVDIVVVEQQDGSFKSSPWYIRFGKFQGVLKAKEKVVNISVDGVEANFHMYLDHKGVAYFLREVDAQEVDCMLSPQSSGEETDGQCSDRRPMKSKSCNYDADRSSSVTQIDLSNGKAVARTSSRRSRILGLVFGRKSMKEERVRVEEDGAGVVRDDSMERAEMAADLLEVKWSTNIPSGRGKNENSTRFQGISDGEADKTTTTTTTKPYPNYLGSDGEADKDSHINDGEDQVKLLMHDNNINNLDNSVTHEDFSQSSFQKLDTSVEANGVEMSHVIMGATILGESGFGGNISLNSETSRETKELGVSNADHDENAKGVKSEIAFPNSQNPDSSMLEACTSKKLEKEHDYADVNGGLSDNDDSKAENGSDRLQSFIHCDCSESSRIGLDGFSKQANETVYLSCEKYEEDLVHTETLHETTEQIYEVNSQSETSILVAKETLNVLAVLGDENSRNSSSDSMILENETISINTNSIVTETYSEMVTVHPINGSAEDVESCSVFTISSFSNRVCVVRDEKSTSEEDEMNNLRPSLEPVGDSQEVTSDFVPNEAINNSPSEVPEEEQFLFSDLDDFKLEEVKCMESIYLASKGTEAVNEAFSSNLESDSSPDKFVLEKLPNDVEETTQDSKIRSSHINIPRNSKVAAQEVGCMADSLPNTWSHFDELDSNHHHGRFLGRSLDSNSEPSKWMLMRKDVASYIKSYGDEEHGLSNSQTLIEDSQLSDELKNLPRSPVVGDPSKIIDASTGSWRLWPFKRSRSMETAKSALICTTDFNAENVLETSVMDPEKDVPNIAENVLETSVMDPEKDVPNNAENVLESTNGMVAEKDVPNPKANKKKIRALSPTSEQLASLNLKEGRNTITFTFSTSMLGKQQVDARIYLWRWDTRIVISDVDGTITKSDLLGQFMPLVGKDWSQTGVAHLFSAIKENGYQMLFLSARAISQAYHTRQFLFNLKQDGKALPDGPVVISPDGLFPSLFREVIRRAPHEFKISCLEDIRALFPSDRNPFYAGFGNRDTDEFSYLKVGIPKGKIFIINPKGEVVVNRRVDSKSYTSLQVLVNGMFPPVSSFEREDYNSWNFWKLPPPAIDI